MDYTEFLKSKQLKVQAVGKEPGEVNPMLFDYQRDVVQWAVRKGRAAMFLDAGLGKTFCQLEWARLIGENTLIIAPLSVADQTAHEEAPKIGAEVKQVRDGAEITGDHKLWITNYENIEKFDFSKFGAVILDESSILKNIAGSTKKKLVKLCKHIPYRLCCSATPAPNDITELSNHAEFLGIMTPQQMTSIFFVHEAGVFQGVKESRWQLKKHAEQDFYRWLSSWAIALKTPSDLGYDDHSFQLPELTTELITVKSDYTPAGMLPGFFAGGISATEAKKVRRETIDSRITCVADMVNTSTEQWLIWAGLNKEGDALTAAIPDAVDVHGSLSPEEKVTLISSFIKGDIRVLVSKISICGFGMNFQHSHNMIFFGLDFSYEGFYQAIKRQWRYGQQHPVKAYVVTSDHETVIYDIVMEKQKEANKMTDALIQATKAYTLQELGKSYQDDWKYRTETAKGKHWTLHLGDSAERMKEIPDDSVHLSVYSPPFADMYIYNNTERDLSNSADLDQFFQHYAFIIQENMRVTMPGRICCVHVQDPKTFKNKEGYRGLRDFTGAVIAAYVKEGWIYRSCITIDKNPQIVASRNKDNDLLFVTGKRDSSNLAPMATDYLLVFKKPGDNPVPITPYDNAEMSEQDWILWAHAIWYDIKETAVLNTAVAKGEGDQKHMCPLQLPLIERCLKLWSNPGETIFSPFAGIGSELYEAVRNRRVGLGIELKPEYWATAQRNLANAELQRGDKTLFDLVAPTSPESEAVPEIQKTA